MSTQRLAQPHTTRTIYAAAGMRPINDEPYGHSPQRDEGPDPV